MASYSSDRRSLLKIFGAVGATCAYPFASDELFAQTAEPHEHDRSPDQPDTQPQFFNKTDFATISRIVDLIIPETDTPGALAAGVPTYVDLVIARNTDQQLVVADGLRWLDAEGMRVGSKRFLELTQKQQLSILEPLCELADTTTGLARGRNVQFFALIKSLTADGFYTSRQGLRQELGYKGNSAMAEYPNCVPEH
jgi:hypothetical protein